MQWQSWYARFLVIFTCAFARTHQDLPFMSLIYSPINLCVLNIIYFFLSCISSNYSLLLPCIKPFKFLNSLNENNDSVLCLGALEYLKSPFSTFKCLLYKNFYSLSFFPDYLALLIFFPLSFSLWPILCSLYRWRNWSRNV